MIILGVDYGDRRIGLALCDYLEMMAYPHKALFLARMRDAADAVAAEAIKEKAEHIVVGLPLNMDGSDGVRAVKTRSFARVLEKITGLTVSLVDERLSSIEADENMSHAKKGKGKDGARDCEAARIILERYLTGRKSE